MAVLHAALRLLLALVLGLGPLGASVVAAALHAPLCACTGCGAEAGEASCCDAGPERDGPVLVAADVGCACAMVLPERDASPVIAPRACVGPCSTLVELARGQRAVELSWSPAASLVTRTGSTGPPRGAREPGPPGSCRAQGPARAVALGALRL